MGLSLLFLGILYWPVFIDPNAFLFNGAGDAFKNYFTYAYHINAGAVWSELEGMHYPYGEHFLYTDCHPFFALVLKWLSGFFPGIPEYSIGILNTWMIWTIVLTPLFLYLILVRLQVQTWVAVAGALSISILAPQIFRLHDHLALSYSFCIPLTWYLAYQVRHKKRRLFWAGVMVINILYWFFTHAYLGAMSAGFVFFYAFFYAIKRLSFRHALLYASSILPVLLFRLIIWLTDHHPGRTNNPSGFFLYNAEPDDLLLPHHPPLRPVLDRLLAIPIQLEYEAWGYIGLIGVITLSGLLVRRLLRVFGIYKKPFLPWNTAYTEILTALGSSALLLLFAFGYPFKAFPELLEIFPVFKQFRATGRFIWPFYMVSGVLVFYVFNRILDHTLAGKSTLVRWGLFGIVCLICFFEGLPYHREISTRITIASNQFSEARLERKYRDVIRKIQPSEYQAILPLPLFEIGSEVFSRPVRGDVVRHSFLLSYHLELPIIGSYLTRTSVPESKKIVQLTGPDFYPREMALDIQDRRPFLVLCSTEPMTRYEYAIMEKGNLLFEHADLMVYHLPFETLFSNDRGPAIRTNFQALKDTLVSRQGFLISEFAADFIYHGFEDTLAPIAFHGTGAKTISKRGNHILWRWNGAKMQPGAEYTIRIWMFHGKPDALNLYFRLILEEMDPQGQSIQKTVSFPEYSPVLYRDWSMVECQFIPERQDSHFRLYTVGQEDPDVPVYVDELLIYRSDARIYREEQGGSVLFYNNHRIR